MKARVQSLNHLAQLAKDGKKVYCDHLNWLEKPKLASELLPHFSLNGAMRHIERGLFYNGPESQNIQSSDTILESVRAKVRNLGLSQVEIAKRIGSTQSRVTEFMNCSSCNTKTLQKFIDLTND